MKNYVKRLLTVAICFVVILFVFLSIMYFVKYSTETTYQEYLNSFLQLKVLGLYALMVLVYPLIGFMTLKRHINKDYAYNRNVIEETFAEAGYVKSLETDQEVHFRKKNAFTRFMLFYMDLIVINKQDNPLKINGLRKELQKINKKLDSNLL